MIGALRRPAHFTAHIDGTDEDQMTDTTEVEQLIKELKHVIATATVSVEDGATEGMARGLRSLRKTNRLLRHSKHAIAQRTRIASLVVDRYARTNPWKVAGIAAGIAFTIGCLVARGDRTRVR
jgi:ElaB/YqjD/DUF883 family membrane-anchored ribosome-binding protein